MAPSYYNDRPNQIRRNGVSIGPGETFESDSDYDAENFPSADDRQVEETGREGQSAARSDAKAAIVEHRRAMGRLSTSALRDRIDPQGHAVRGSGADLVQNQPTVAPEGAPPPHDPGTPEPDSASTDLSTAINEAALEEQGGSDDGDVDATDGAVEAADELGVDLSEVEGSGADGKVTKADVEKHAKGAE